MLIHLLLLQHLLLKISHKVVLTIIFTFLEVFYQVIHNYLKLQNIIIKMSKKYLVMQILNNFTVWVQVGKLWIQNNQQLIIKQQNGIL